MKTNRLFIMALAVAAAVSCAKETDVPSAPSMTASAFTAEKENFEVASKAVLDGRKSKWEAGDEIAVHADGAAAVKFSTAADGEVAEFTSETSVTGSSFLLAYPYSAAKGVQDGKLLLTVPAEQVAVTGSFDPAAAISAAASADLAQPVKFKNALALLKINVPADLDKKVIKITVEAKGGESLAGDILFDVASKANTLSADGKAAVSLLAAPPMAAGDYYLAVRPCDLPSGVKVTVLLGDKSYYTRESGACEFDVNTIYNMGVIGSTGWSVTTYQYAVSTVLGDVTTTSSNAIVTGTGAAAHLRSGQDIQMAPDGNFWITTRFASANHGIWKMTPDYTLSKIAVVADDADLTDTHPWGAAFDNNGNYYFAAKGKGKVMTCSADGSVSVVSIKKADDTEFSLGNVMRVDFDDDNNMYAQYRTKLIKVADGVIVNEWALSGDTFDWFCFNEDKTKAILFGYTGVFEIDLTTTSSTLVRVAGKSTKHTNAATYTDGKIGYPQTATCQICNGAICLSDGTVVFGDAAAKSMRILIPDVYGNYTNGTVVTVLGDPWSSTAGSSAQAVNASNGVGKNGRLSSPAGLALDANGDILFVDGLQNGMVRKMTVSTVTEQCGLSGDHQDYAGTDGMTTIF